MYINRIEHDILWNVSAKEFYYRVQTEVVPNLMSQIIISIKYVIWDDTL